MRPLSQNLKNILQLLLVGFLLSGSWAQAQELVPATSEDQENFDMQAEQAQTKATDAKAKITTKSTARTQFSSGVTAEAKKLKDDSTDSRKQMGKLVSGQKRKTQTNTNSGSSNAGGNADAKNSSPLLNNAGGGPGTNNGQSGNHKK